jgi:hypothetical protein
VSSIKNTTNFYHLNTEQQKSLKFHLNKLDLHNKLILILNKKIEKFSHDKISDKLGGSLNQSIIFNFNNNTKDRRLINIDKKLKKIKLIEHIHLLNSNEVIKLLRIKNSELDLLKINNNNRISIITNVINIITNFFTSMSCLINRPQFIHKPNKLIIRIFFYKNNLNKYNLLNHKTNLIYNLLNGTNILKTQYNSYKNQNQNLIINNMLGQTK